MNQHESLFESDPTLMDFIFLSGFHRNELAQIITL